MQQEIRPRVQFHYFVLLIAFSVIGCLFLLVGLNKYTHPKIRKPLFTVDDQLDDSDEFQTEDKSKTKRLPKALIIGAKKCGTAALIEFINVHPRVRICHDEVHFFDDDEKYALGYEWYRDQMPPSHAEQITMEKSPKYFVTKSAPRRIHKMNPDTKLILIVRDPVTRAVSDYVHIKYAHQPDLPPFETLAINETTGKVNTDWRPIMVGMYAKHFRNWLKLFPREQILVVSGDKLIADPFSVVEQVEEFLGLKPIITRDHFFYSETKGFMCMMNFRKTKRKCLHKAKGREHPQVDTQVLQKLRDFYLPWNDEFYNMTGENFGWY